jgi:hypothetical protein
LVESWLPLSIIARIAFAIQTLTLVPSFLPSFLLVLYFIRCPLDSKSDRQKSLASSSSPAATSDRTIDNGDVDDDGVDVDEGMNPGTAALIVVVIIALYAAAFLVIRQRGDGGANSNNAELRLRVLDGNRGGGGGGSGGGSRIMRLSMSELGEADGDDDIDSADGDGDGDDGDGDGGDAFDGESELIRGVGSAKKKLTRNPSILQR